LQTLKNQGKSEDAKAALWARCATDIELFARTYFPHYCTYPFNELHRDMFKATEFGERSVRRARAAPRGFAKSTVEALIKPIHDVCYGLEKFIVIFSNTQDQAYQKLRDIRSEIFNNHRLVNDYSIHFRVKNPGSGEYILYCMDHACLFQGFGSATEVRGIRFGAERPTKIIVDDGEHSEEVLNESIRKKYEDWMFQVVSKLGNKKTNISVIGTILHPESLLTNLIKNPAYDGKIYKAIISWSERQDLWDKWKQIYINLDEEDRKTKADLFYKENEVEMLKGVKVLWPEKESYLDLQKELIETGKRAFWKEKMNEPIGGDDHLFEELHYYRETSEGFLIEKTGQLVPWKHLKGANGEWLSSFGAIDPATGQTPSKPGKSSDYACLVTAVRDPKGRIFIHHDITKRISPTKQIASIFDLHVQWNYSKYAVETNLYRNLLLPNIMAEKKRIEQEIKKAVKIPFYDVLQVENKQKRIYTLEPKIAHGWILFNRSLSQEFIRMFDAYPFGDHDDAPDCVHIVDSLINGRYKASPLSMDAIGNR
jgi:predicted phage terminase large subunit-like protein